MNIFEIALIIIILFLLIFYRKDDYYKGYEDGYEDCSKFKNNVINKIKKDATKNN